MRRTLLLCCTALFGCDALTVHPFDGSVLVMSIQQDPTAGATPAGRHLELWARDRFDDLERLPLFYDGADYKTTYGVTVRKTITLDDPCMIDAHGNRLVDAAAWPATIDEGGITQTPEQQAVEVRNRIAQLNAPPDGTQPSSLLALVPWDPSTPPAIDAAAAPADRLAACRAWWASSELAYTPNPLQITSPLHGYVYGFLAYVTAVPPTDYDGIRIDTPVNLDGVEELFVTDEGPSVDVAARGAVYLTSTPAPGGNDVAHFDLAGPKASGTLAILSALAGAGQ
ncbi:MAG TPA: hypothetical protein VF334_21355 [Polyangia bacterium]